VRWLQKRLWVSFPGKAELMEVGIARHDPQEAVTLVNAVVEAYLHEVVNPEQDKKRLRLGEIDRAVTEKTAEVRALRESLKKKCAELGASDTATLSLKQRLVLEDAGAARQELVQVKAELRRSRSDLASQKALLESPDIFGKLREEVKAERLATIRADVKRLETAIATATAERQGLETEMQQKRKEAERLGAAAAEVAGLQSDIKNAETLLHELAAERDKFRVECRRAPRVQLLIPAAVHKPGKPAEEPART
jgi:chromosome segregation ATPase